MRKQNHFENNLLIKINEMIFKIISFLFVCSELIISNNHCNTQPAPGSFNAQEDAKVIFNAKDRNQVLLDILPNRDIKQCEQINAEFSKLNDGIAIIAEAYVPQTGTSLQDLLFALIKGPQRTKLSYLYSMLEMPFCPYRSNQRIVMEILVLEDKNKRNLTFDYNFYYPRPLHLAVGRNNNDDYLHVLEQLVNRTREEKYNGPSHEEGEIAKQLDDERKKDGSWGDHRDLLDSVLMQKPREFVLKVMEEYAKNNHGNQLRDDIGKKLDDKNIKFGYESLIDFLVDRNKYMATRIQKARDDDNDYDGTLILIIVCFSENGLKDVNDVFQKENGKSIKDFLLEGDNPSITRKMLAAIADKKSQIAPPSANSSPQPTAAPAAPAPAS